MKLNFAKGGGLLPVIIQHYRTKQVLMLGYMDEKAWAKTNQEGKVTFYSRSKDRLWTKGEESGHFLWVQEILPDCDYDTLLILASPDGETCHKGTASCFGETTPTSFLYELETIIEKRINHSKKDSYTLSLYEKGINRIAQKVGEEAIELILEAKDDNTDLFLNEVADLLYHLLVLMHFKKGTLEDVERILRQRNTDLMERNLDT